VSTPSSPAKPRSKAAKQERIREILAILDHVYPNVTCALDHRNAWELLVATILSAQCTDARVNLVTPQLFARYPTVRDLAVARFDDVAAIIRSTGFFNNKAKSIIGAAQTILSDFGGEVPRDLDQLLTVPGAARKTANVVLGTAFRIPSGVVVDTHVHRISRRLDLTKADAPVPIERDLIQILPQDRWIRFSHQIIHFGRDTCVARKPKCGSCPMSHVCYSPDKVT
jgi:endonuclease-3